MRRLKQAILQLLKDVLKTNPQPSQDSCAVVLSKDCRFGIQVRFGMLAILIIFLATAIIRRVWVYQVPEHEEHLKDANTILGFRQHLIGTRGEIYDFDNNLLVGNIRTKDLYITPKIITDNGSHKPKLENLQQFVQFLAPQVGLTEKEITDKCLQILQKELVIQVAQNVKADQAGAIQSLSLPGVSVYHSSIDANLWEISFRPMAIDDDSLRDQIILFLEEKLTLEKDSLFTQVIRGMRRQTPIPLVKHLSIEKAETIATAFTQWNAILKNGKFKRNKIPKNSMHFEDSTVRFYPKEKLMANLLGFCDSDDHGLSGIERLMDNEMKASRATRHIVLDGNVSRGNISQSIYTDQLNGYNVHLTIQLPIQQIVETSLERLVAKHHPKRAYIVMMDPKTGAIMALAQYPNFNFNDKGTVTKKNREFHALVSGYEPGSIMKGVSVSSVMDYAKITPETIIDCENGRWLFAGKYLKEHGHAHFGDISIREIIQKSSNIGSAKAVIENMSETVFYQYLRGFGMGQRTCMGFFPPNQPPRYFKGESNGMLAPVSKWYKIDISRIAIGHTIMVTPFQMVQAYGAIANGGEMMQPYIVDRIVSPAGKTIQSIPFKKGQPISAQAAEEIIDCLCATVQKGGTGTRGNLQEYNVAAKTGTAMKLARDANGKLRYSSSLNTASFIGIAPVEDPAFVLLITADEPSGKEQYGGSVCGDHFAEIAGETLKILQIPPTKKSGDQGVKYAMKSKL